MVVDHGNLEFTNYVKHDTYPYMGYGCSDGFEEWGVRVVPSCCVDFTLPANGGSTVDCPADTDAVPTPPTINDNCGNPITPTGPVVSAKPTCEGTRTYTWTYTCLPYTHDWVYTYTVEYETFPALPANGGSIVDCPADTDVVPTPPAGIVDNCGNAITPTGPVVGTKPVCEGNRTYTWTYTDCEGNSRVWVYTYTVEYETFPALPANGNSTVVCPNGLYTPTPPTVYDNCGNVITPTGPVISGTPVCPNKVTYTWTYTDCEGNTHDWTYTFTCACPTCSTASAAQTQPGESRFPGSSSWFTWITYNKGDGNATSPKTYPIYTGQTHRAGTLKVYDNGTWLYVIYSTQGAVENGCQFVGFSQYHLEVDSTITALYNAVTNKSGNPVAGRCEYNGTLNYVPNTDPIKTDNISDYATGKTFYIFAHSLVCSYCSP